MEIKKIKIMAAYDWTMTHAVDEFLKFLDPVIRHQGKEYKIEFGRVVAKPFLCGQNLNEDVDFVIDRTTHWNEVFKCWAQQALNSNVPIINHPNTFFTYDKHIGYDIMARAMHPDDHFPTTVLLPPYHPYTEDLKRQQRWKYQQELIAEYTDYGFDDERRKTDWKTVNDKMERSDHYEEQGELVRKLFYPGGNYLKEVVETHFHDKFPIYLKKANGGGGVDVFKIENMEELYRKYDKTGGKAFHLQEAIVDYEIFIRCLALGPQVLPMKFQPEQPLHEHYGPERPSLKPELEERIINYCLFINSYHRWTYNSYEAIIKDSQICPIDFANACPDTHFTSLHVHFPWAICAIVRWCAYCAVTGQDMRIDMEQREYLKKFHDPSASQLEKYQFCVAKSKEYFAVDKFRAFCEENFPDIKEKMIRFYDERFEEVLRLAIHFSDFPKHEHERFYHQYRNMMESIFRPNAMEYLTSSRFCGMP